MPNENVTPADIKATAAKKARNTQAAAAEKAAKVQDVVEEKVEDFSDAVEDNVDTAVARVNNLSTNQKLLVVAALSLVGSVVVQKILERFRKPEIVIEEQNVTVVAP